MAVGVGRHAPRAVLGELLRAAENRHARVAVLSAAPPTIIPIDSDIGGFRKFRTIGPFEVYAQSIADPSVSVDQSGSTEYAMMLQRAVRAQEQQKQQEAQQAESELM